MKTCVSASILSADFLHLKDDVEKVKESGADMLHFDVMDGIFVNNISFGLPVLEVVNKCTDICLDVHLMIQSPLKYIQRFADAGADIITFHLEASDDADEVINAIRKSGKKVGLSIKPNTPFEDAIAYMDKIDMLLIMTVEPGFGGQSYIEAMNDKIKSAKDYITANNLDVTIQVDGGINEKTAVSAVGAGANILVAGSYLFKADCMKSAVESIRC